MGDVSRRGLRCHGFRRKTSWRREHSSWSWRRDRSLLADLWGTQETGGIQGSGEEERAHLLGAMIRKKESEVLEVKNGKCRCKRCSPQQILDMLEEYRIGNLFESTEPLKNTENPYANDPIRHPALKPASMKPFNAEPPLNILAQNFLTPK